jgi:hypothetical protein
MTELVETGVIVGIDDFEVRLGGMDSLAKAQARVERVVAMQQVSDMAWIDVMEHVWHLKNDVVFHEGETRYAWQLIDPDVNWTQFAMDRLGLCRSDTSLVPNVWDTFVVILGYSRGDLLRAGVGRLKHSVGYVRARWEECSIRDYGLEQAIFGVLPEMNQYSDGDPDETEAVDVEPEPEPESVAIVDMMIAQARENQRGEGVAISVQVDRDVSNGDGLLIVAWRDGLAFDIGEIIVNWKPKEGTPWSWDDVSWRELVNAVVDRIDGRIKFGG